MPVTIPVTVCVPDLVVQRVSTEGDLVVGEFKMGPAPKQWDTHNEEARRLFGWEDLKAEETRQLYSSLMLTMLQSRRTLDDSALKSFLETKRPDGIAAFVHQYGLFKRPEKESERIRVSIQDFKREQVKLRALLRVWTSLKEGETEDASEIAKESCLEFAGDPRFALSVNLTAKVAHRSILTFVATGDRLEPILYCRDVLTGLYALLFKTIVAGRPWALCPNCDTAFSMGCADKKFCTESCQQAYKQRRYRKTPKRKTKRSKRRKR